MGFVPNRAYSNPEIGNAMTTIAGMFAPPDPSELVNYAQAGALRQKQQIIEQLKGDPRYQGADAAVLADLYDPTNSWQAQDQNDATKRYGIDTTAATSRANNRENAQFDLLGRRFDTTVGQGEMMPAMPAGVSGFLGIPSLPAVKGDPKPLSETEWRAGELERLLKASTITDDDIARDFRSDLNIEEVLGENGKPIIVSRDAAIGMQPAPSAPTTSVQIGPNGEPYGNPGDGLVWARTEDGQIRLDERGAPVAIPYQGGKAFEEQRRREEAAAAGDTKDATKASVVLQNIDRALDSIEANPTFTTGLGAQATGWIGGSPARALQAVLSPIAANIGFDQLQAMRDASPTGGALGQVTERELAFLQSVLGDIDPEAGPQIIDDIKRLKNIYLDTVHGPGNGPARERLSFPSQWDAHAQDPQSEVPETYAINPATGERLVLRDGAWNRVE